MLFAKISQDPLLSTSGVIENWITVVSYICLFVLVLLMVFFILRMAVIVERAPYKVLLFLFALLMACLFISFISFQPDDEILISYFAYHALLNLTNPYSLNYASELIPALAQVGSYGTVMTNGTIIGTYNYPALYLLVQIPFFGLASTFNGLGRVVMPLEYMVFFGVFLFVFYKLLEEKKNGFPVYSAVVLASIAFIAFSSTIVLLMLALMLAMYTKWAKEPAHSGILLGLMASLQTQMWVFALIFLVNKLMATPKDYNYRGMYLSATAVFLLFNGAFMVSNTDAFVGNLISAGNLLPDSIAPIGSLLLIAGAPIYTLIVEFVCFTIIVCCLCAWIDPYWFPLMSAIPFLFLAHALPIYYMLPFAAFALLQDGTYERTSR